MLITNGKPHIDHSRRSCATACLRKYYYQYVRNLSPEHGSTALRYGSTWHAFLDGYYSSKMAGGTADENYTAAYTQAKDTWERESALQTFFDDYRTFENCAKSFIEYNSFYANDFAQLEVTAIEKAFCIEFKDYYFEGKLDLQVLMGGLSWLMEHKTTGQHLSMQTSRLSRAPQTIGYWAAQKILGIEGEGAIINLAHLSAIKSKVTGEYGKPKIEFTRSPQIYTQHDINDWKTQFDHEVDRILRCMDSDIWPKNFDNCYQYGQCSFLNICDQHRPLGEENTNGYVTKVWDVKTTVKEVLYAVG